MAAAKNTPRGEAHYNHKLTADDCRLIRELIAERHKHLAAARALSDKAIAEKFEITAGYVWRVGNRGARFAG